MREPILCLEDILDAMVASQSFIKNMDFHEFNTDLKTRSAVLAQLSLIGEAVKKLPEQTRKAHPEIAWRSMAGMRDRLIHGYFRVDYSLVWHTVTQVLPEEKRAVERIIAEWK